MAGSGQNVYQNVATGMTNAGTGLNNAMNYQPMQISVADRDMNKYLNPYTQNVIDNTMNTLADANKIANQQISDKADSMNAFGGNRMAVQQGIQNAKFGELATNMASKLNEANYNQALANTQFDTTSNLQADMSNQTAGLNANQQNIAGATALGQLANLGFTQGQTLQNQQAREGALIQALNQAILDAENKQVEGFLNQPNNALATLISGRAPLTASAPSTKTETRKLGLFDWLTGLGEAFQGYDF